MPYQLSVEPEPEKVKAKAKAGTRKPKGTAAKKTGTKRATVSGTSGTYCNGDHKVEILGEEEIW